MLIKQAATSYALRLHDGIPRQAGIELYLAHGNQRGSAPGGIAVQLVVQYILPRIPILQPDCVYAASQVLTWEIPRYEFVIQPCPR